MAKTERPAAAARPADEPPARIAVTNMCRHRPIQFHFSGGSARLGPLEMQELDPATLASPELAHLVASGLVQVRDMPAAAEGAPVDRKKPPAGGGTEG